jgi:hypothetical protein
MHSTNAGGYIEFKNGGRHQQRLIVHCARMDGGDGCNLAMACTFT